MKQRQDFKSALIGKTVPLLILDQKWHRLFAVHGKTEEIKELEAQLNTLLTEQAKLNTRLKELKKLKGKLLDEIVQSMEENEKKLEDIGELHYCIRYRNNMSLRVAVGSG